MDVEERQHGQRQSDARGVDQRAQLEPDERSIGQHEGPQRSNPESEPRLRPARDRDAVRDDDPARLQVAPEPGDRDQHEQDLEVRRERHGVQELPGERDRDRGRGARDRPAPAQEVEPPVAPGGTAHHDRECDEARRRGQGGKAPDGEDQRDGLLAREHGGDARDQGIAEPREQPHPAVPRHDVAPALEPAPERDRQRERRQRGQRGQQADVVGGRAEPEQEHRQVRARRRDNADEYRVDLDQGPVVGSRRGAGLGRRHGRNATAQPARRLPDPR